MTRPRRRIDPAVVDLLVAGVVLAGGLIEVALTADLEGSRGANLAMTVLLAAALVWRRRRPLAALAGFVALAALQSLLLGSVQELVMPYAELLLLSYAAGAHLDRSRAIAAIPLQLGIVAVVNLTAGDATAGDYLFPTGFAVLAWMAGRAVRARMLLTEELHEAAVRAREEHEEEARRATAGERRRIAREMHDIVAHSVSVMVIQAGGARRILDRDPERAVEAAALIEHTGRAALTEMRLLLGVLAAGDADRERAPQPTLANLGTLVANAGVPATLTIEGDRRPLPAGIDLAAYRIVQEALTNVIKHGGAAATEVSVRWGDDALELMIADRGPGPARAASAGGGQGLVGMEERVRLLGGELRTGRRRGGGFEVRARIPLERAEVAA